MFGVYDFFPKTYHGIARFSFNVSTRELQGIIIDTLYQLNRGKVNFQDFAQFNIEVILEFGIADGVTFNYLDRETLKYCSERLHKQTSPKLDFFCVSRYYLMGKGKRRPLKFDYYILRFIFDEKEAELQVFHEKGTQRLSVKDLIILLMKNINRKLARKNLGSLNVTYKHAL